MVKSLFQHHSLKASIFQCLAFFVFQLSHPYMTTRKTILYQSVSQFSCSVVSNSLQPHGLQPTRLLCPWDFPGKNTGLGCHFLLQKIFPVLGLNPCLPCCRQTLYYLSHQKSHLMRRTDSLEKTLMLGKIEGRRRRGQQRMRWLDDITNMMDMSLSRLQEDREGQGSLACCSP